MFRLFPASRDEKLSEDDRLDVEINLHSFLINVYGILENIALAIAYENALMGDNPKGKLNVRQVSLFNRDFRRRLSSQLRSYLGGQTLAAWYRQYAKNYRDALAHRILPYVPPAALNPDEARKFKDLEAAIREATDPFRIRSLQEEQSRLGRSNPHFVHSFSENSKPLYLHPQLLADFGTVEDILKNAIDHFYCDPTAAE